NAYKKEANPISRILFSAMGRTSIIYLGLPSLAGSSGLPVAVTAIRRTGNEQLPGFRNLFGLSTPGGYRDACRHAKPWALTPRFHPYPESIRDGLFSVALSVSASWRTLPVRKRGALCCPDFPPRQMPER